MAGNVIFRRGDSTPRTISKPVNGALLPGTWVEETATQLSPLITAVGKNPLILGAIDFKDQTVDAAYTDGDTGIGFQPRPQDVFNCAIAAGTYAKNAPLTIGAAGRLVAATANSVVVAHYDGPTAAQVAGALVDVVIANAYVQA